MRRVRSKDELAVELEYRLKRHLQKGGDPQVLKDEIRRLRMSADAIARENAERSKA